MCVCVYDWVCVCVCACVSKRETPATGGGGVHIKFIGDLSILVVFSLSCHCVPTVWHSEAAYVFISRETGLKTSG